MNVPICIPFEFLSFSIFGSFEFASNSFSPFVLLIYFGIGPFLCIFLIYVFIQMLETTSAIELN